jgi:catechol 2,3-dioxygenase-like lactoylglutathione lyase family enzyme
MILDHIGLSVSDYESSKSFFTMALAPIAIAIALAMEIHGWAGFGRAGQAQFWFGVGPGPQGPMHIAFAAQDRAQVQAFRKAALAAGATDNGGPGVRTIYHPNYYGAFVIGPDEHNIEAVCHTPPI